MSERHRERWNAGNEEVLMIVPRRVMALATVVFWTALLTAVPALAQTCVPGSSLRDGIRVLGCLLGSEQAGSVVATLTDIEVSTAPLGTSTGGFTFTFDPTLRTWKRSASSFGPAFAERALTTGKAKISAGFNYLHASYRSLEGFNLHNGDLQPALNIQGDPFHTVATSLQLNMSSDTVVAFGHVGVTDDLDVGVAVPWVRVRVDGVGQGLGSSGNVLQTVVLAAASSSGIGDVAIFGKYRLWRQAEGGVAAAVDVRLPSGDKNALRGLDVTRTLISGVWSQGGSRVSPHANVGYEFWSKAVPISLAGDVAAKDQFKYAVGLEFEAHPRMTAVVDLVGRQLLKGGALEYQHFSQRAGTVVNGAVVCPGPADCQADVLVAVPKGIHQLALAPSIKWNAFQSVLITGNVLVSLNQRGLRAAVIPVVGLDWAF
ncbi:MAG TPA: transporter [Vicinamibacterales bacterium]|nr:transporter [Vicinamibacterales bacterium]